jgi:hypothetical protein
MASGGRKSFPVENDAGGEVLCGGSSEMTKLSWRR